MKIELNGDGTGILLARKTKRVVWVSRWSAFAGTNRTSNPIFRRDEKKTTTNWFPTLPESLQLPEPVIKNKIKNQCRVSSHVTCKIRGYEKFWNFSPQRKIKKKKMSKNVAMLFQLVSKQNESTKNFPNFFLRLNSRTKFLRISL